jgi:hypothetical protein
MLVHWLMKLYTDVVLHCSLFVLWMLPNSREAGFCTSKFETYSIANTPENQIFWLLLSLSLHRYGSWSDTHYTSALLSIQFTTVHTDMRK